MNAIYLRRRRRVHVNAGDGDLPLTHLATALKNIENLGFVFSPELAARLRTLSVGKFESFYKGLIKDLRVMTGAHREFRPMYPNFPSQVMRQSEAQLYYNAIIHYLTHRLPETAKEERPELTEWSRLRVIDLGTREDFESILSALVRARSSLSAEDKADLVWFVAQYRDEIARLLPREVPFKENLAVLGAALIKHTSLAGEFLAERIKTATDVLRLAVAMSDGDVSLAAPTKFTKFRRSERRLFLGWLERTGDPTEDMRRWGERWKRLGERLHPGEYAEQFPKTAAAFTAVRRDLAFESFNTRIEKCLATHDATGALGLLQNRPGDLARRIDSLARLGEGAGEVVEAFRRLAPDVSTPVLLQVLTHFRHRDERADLRIFFPKGEVAKVYATANHLLPLAPGLANSITEACESALVARFAGRPRLGRCYLDPALEKYLVPFAQRSASKALRTLVRGSRLPMPHGNILRFFLWWKNGRSRTDIDLSAAIYGPDFKYLDVVSYYNLKNFGGCHSGDIVDAPQGAAEFIDLDLRKLAAAKVGYVVMSLNSFTSQPYCDLPECFAGWMSRQEAGSGEIFEPRTVQDKVDVAANTQICLPAIFDVANREVIWADIALQEQPLWNNVKTNLCGVSLMLRAIISLKKTNLATLFGLHVRARGEEVADRRAAETIFAVDEGITPFDLDRIRADFL